MAEEISKKDIYTPEEIPDQPFPGQEGTAELVGGKASGGVYTPTEIKDKPFPTKRIAQELISAVLNTKSKKILGEFQFTPSGAIQIGKYANGVSGDLRLSPAGITARNISGLTTFAIDADTGDAVFKGDVRAGSLISEATIEGGAININDVFTVDADGNLVATSATISGYITTGGAATDVNDGATTISGTKLTTGTVTADYVIASASLSSPVITGGTIAIGSGNNIFKADTNGIYLGHATFASAPFQVNMAGSVTAKGVTIKDSAGTSFIDSTGLIGTQSFNVAQAGSTNSTSTSTTSTSLVDIPNTSVSFSISRSRLLLAILSAEFAFMDANGGLEAYIRVGGDVNDVQEPRISLKGSVHRATGSGDYITLTTYVFRNITANSPPTSYTLTGRWKVDSGVTGYVRNRQLSYYLLGK